MDGRLVCQICKKSYSSVSAKNKHCRIFHSATFEIKKRILCTLCSNDEAFETYLKLIQHLRLNHGMKIKESVLNFKNFEEFNVWKALDSREVDYACRTRYKFNGGEKIIYDCNRTDSRGFTSICRKNNSKTGGSIRIQGTCPSRIQVIISNNGEVTVQFTETHAGHDNEMRRKRLPTTEKAEFVQKLSAGVTIDQKIQDARKIGNISEKKNSEDDCLQTSQTSTSHLEYQIEEKSSLENVSLTFSERREKIKTDFIQFISTLDENDFNKVAKSYMKTKNSILQKYSSPMSVKRKLGK